MLNWDFDKRYAKDFECSGLWTLEELAEYEREQEAQRAREAEQERRNGYVIWKKMLITL